MATENPCVSGTDEVALPSCSQNTGQGLLPSPPRLLAKPFIPAPPQPVAVKTVVLIPEYAFGIRGAGKCDFNTIEGFGVTSSGYIAVIDGAVHMIKIFSWTGVLMCSFVSHGLKCGQFVRPAALTTVRITGEILLLEASNWPRVHVFSEVGLYRRSIGVGYFRCPRALAVDKHGDILVVMQIDQRTGLVGVEVFGYRKGEHQRTLQLSSHVSTPTGIAVMHQPRQILISDSQDNCVKVFDLYGCRLFKIGDGDVIPCPLSVHVGSSCGVYVVSSKGSSYQLVLFSNLRRVEDVWPLGAEPKSRVGLTFMPFEKGVVMASADEKIRVYQYGTVDTLARKVELSGQS